MPQLQIVETGLSECVPENDIDWSESLKKDMVAKGVKIPGEKVYEELLRSTWTS